MPSASENRLVRQAAMVAAVFFYLMSLVQVAHALLSLDLRPAVAFAAQQQHVMRHVPQEVSSGSPRLPNPEVISHLSIIPVSHQYFLPQTTAFVPLWPIEKWPEHRRVSRSSTDPPYLT
jgi:hypothetical protein